MSFDSQNLIVLALVALAGCYLARSLWRTIAQKKSGCGGCGSCPNNATAIQPQVIGIQPLAGRAKDP